MKETDLVENETYTDTAPERTGNGTTMIPVCGGQAKKWLKTIAAVLACLMLLLGESLLQYAGEEPEMCRDIPTVQETAAA